MPRRDKDFECIGGFLAPVHLRAPLLALIAGVPLTQGWDIPRFLLQKLRTRFLTRFKIRLFNQVFN